MGFKLFKILLSVVAILLFIQFYLGMNINLFVVVPLISPQNFASYSGGAEVLAHLINSILILSLAGIILSYGSRLRNKWVFALSAVAMGFAVVAVTTGATFAFRVQDDSISLAMAISFTISYTVYLVEFYLVDKLQAIDSSFR
jgi:hypothetical protein